MKAPTQEMREELAAAGKLRLELMARQIRELARANQRLIEGEQSAAIVSDASQVAFAEAFIYTKVYTNDKGFKLPSGAYVSFDGDAWGLCFGGGVSWMVATFTVPENEIYGDVAFNFNSAGGQTNLNWFRDGTPIGVAVGAGLGVSIGVTGGSGKLKKK